MPAYFFSVSIRQITPHFKGQQTILPQVNLFVVVRFIARHKTIRTGNKLPYYELFLLLPTFHLMSGRYLGISPTYFKDNVRRRDSEIPPTREPSHLQFG